MPARARPTALLAALALAAGGCGEPRGDATRTTPELLETVTTATPARPVARTDVSLIEYRLPHDARVAQPGTIAFVVTNDGALRHALAVDGPAGEVRTRALLPGEQTTIEIRLPRGTYRWYCPLGDHEQRGMVGRVHVGE